MSKINTKYISWNDIPVKVREELVQEADLVAQDDCDSRIVLYEHTINNIIVVNQGLGDNEEDREHSIELVEFAEHILDHDVDWYIVE